MAIGYRTVLKVEAVASFFLALFFLGFNITGFAISDIPQRAINWWGIVFFGFGIMAVSALVLSKNK